MRRLFFELHVGDDLAKAVDAVGGEGGTRKTVDGIDFWSNGSPPRKFILIGYIYDRRHKTGLWGAIAMDNLFSDISEVVKREGGDGVIVLSAQTEDVGTVSNGTVFTPPAGGNTWGVATTARVQKQITRCAVIKYMPDDTPVTPPSAPPQMPPGVPSQ